MKIEVTGMSCQHCVNRVTNAVQQSAGVEKVSVDLESGEVSFDKPDNVDAEQITAAIESAGYQVKK